MALPRAAASCAAGLAVAAATVLCVVALRGARSDPPSRLAASGPGSLHIAMNVQPMWIPPQAITTPGADFWGWAFLVPVTTSAGSPPVSTSPQWTMVDAGSANLAFCSRKPFEPLAQYAPEGRYKAEVQGEMRPAIACLSYGSGLSGWWGYYFHMAQTSVPSTDGGSVALSPGGFLSVMKESALMLCSDDGFTAGGGVWLNGIFGIGGREITRFKFYRDDSLVTLANCADYSSPNYIRMETGGPNPLRDLMSGSPTLSKLALHWSGHVGEGAGQMYLDDAAEDNEHFDPQARIGPVLSSFSGYFVLNVTGFEVVVDGAAVVNKEFRVLGTGHNSILDTGASSLKFPSAFMQALRAGWGGALAGGTVNIVMAGPGGSVSRLPIAVDQLKQLYEFGPMDEGLVKEAPDSFMFGSIGFLFVDLVVFDFAKSLTTFMPRPADKVILPTVVPPRPAPIA